MHVLIIVIIVQAVGIFCFSSLPQVRGYLCFFIRPGLWSVLYIYTIPATVQSFVLGASHMRLLVIAVRRAHTGFLFSLLRWKFKRVTTCSCNNTSSGDVTLTRHARKESRSMESWGNYTIICMRKQRTPTNLQIREKCKICLIWSIKMLRAHSKCMASQVLTKW